MKASESYDDVAPSGSGTDAERGELDWLLTSGVLGRSGHLTRVLTYICEEHFQGRADSIKEYSIATLALGRRADFDPQSDTIVRVTVHSLRKRLLEVYRIEGADRPLRLVIPPGRYAPSFLDNRKALPPHSLFGEQANGNAPEVVNEVVLPLLIPDRRTVEPLAIPTPLPKNRPALSWSWMVAGLAVAALATVTWFVLRHQPGTRWGSSSSALLAPAVPQETVRALMGASRNPYVDHSGNVWAAADYCHGGTNVQLPAQKISGTQDPALFLSGVRGIAHCVFPVTGSLYEVRFNFAETADLQPGVRVATLSINDRPGILVDVVDNAGGEGIATSTIVTDVAPETDGAIHVDLISEISLLNSVEILPAPSARQLPVRIVAAPKAFVDADKQSWGSDRYFSGGRHGQVPRLSRQTGVGLYASDRIGRFRYIIPAVPFARYRVKLYFRERWFGKENGWHGGPGSRVFDVECNGTKLLNNFDLLATAGAEPVVKTFENIQASGSGRIELYFVPVVNYAIVNAIEVLPEN